MVGMKIVVNMGHPAHVHFFKNFIWKMERNGHEYWYVKVSKTIVIATILKLLFHWQYKHCEAGRTRSIAASGKGGLYET